MKRFETSEELVNEFGQHYGFSFFMIDVDVNDKNVNKAHELISNGYSPEEIKNKLQYQGWYDVNSKF